MTYNYAICKSDGTLYFRSSKKLPCNDVKIAYEKKFGKHVTVTRWNEYDCNPEEISTED